MRNPSDLSDIFVPILFSDLNRKSNPIRSTMANQFQNMWPYLALGAQIYLFYSIEAWETRAALVLFMAYQFWKTSRNNNGPVAPR